GFRPAVDPLFRSAAETFGDRVVAIVLSGAMDDGTSGLAAVQARGGTTIVQDPKEALVPDMPRNALNRVRGARVLPAAAVGPAIARLASEPNGRRRRAIRHSANVKAADGLLHGLEAGMAGKPSGFSCPECGGALWQSRQKLDTRFRCHVGHAYTELGLVNG